MSTAAVVRIPVPRTVHEVRRLLGMVGWYRKFIPRFSTISKPLNSLLEGEKTFRWSQECQDSFDTLKLKLSTSPVLTHPHVDRMFALTTDASTVGIGAELARETPAGLRPVYYFSRTLSKSERRYSTYDREFLAIVMAIRHFRHHLLGTTFRLRTDHRHLQFMLTTKNPWGRQARWIVELEEYSFAVNCP